MSRYVDIEPYEREGWSMNRTYQESKTTMVYETMKLEDVPTAEIESFERKKGEWLKAYGDHEAIGVRPFYRYCSRCSESTIWPYNFCPNCGADMRGKENERIN